ncbi:PucR family transcriptional regulator [Pseudonocardia alaniniphila]|uniref:Helix-turn-helix domain-containing protein n=1 Tax=Pseudonocardia alaniniphila TaxID=75291 RepID=A0ABS9TSX8_9PSEU|nr:helix-turn-helix domain-containing protein [Pseudonocardia alaniniphila]MCH6171473.1 helix-turn-helix domain-containing protein [Pseudonocardia alaniniphila]
MARATREILLATLHRHLPEIADHVSEAALAAIPAYADFDEDLRCPASLALRSFIEHVEGKRNEIDHSLIEYARQLALRGIDGGTLAHWWRVLNHELWVWLTTKCPTEFDLQGDGLAVWNELLAVHERYVGAGMDAFFETQSELRASELVCRHASLDALLDGRASDETATMLKVLGIRSEKVLIARFSFTGTGPNDPAEPSSRFEPLVRDIQAHTRRLPWTVSDGRLILCLPHDERTRESLASLADRLEPTVRVGVSRPWPITGNLAVPNRQAELALRGAGPTTRLVDFGALSLVQIAALQVDLNAEDVPPALTTLLAEDARSGHEWVRTAEALTQSHGSISGAASALRVHANTIYYRITAARSVSGLDLRNPMVLADIQFIQACRAFGTYDGAGQVAKPE